MADFVSISKHEFLNLDCVESIFIEPERMKITLSNGAVRYVEPDYSIPISSRLLARLSPAAESAA